ncbi:MAG: WD40 repeat domain-containing protein [Armatimonadetes bacterium]|nr:WD40 repeat domain-containing protein [Armatimonadota bacterium]
MFNMRKSLLIATVLLFVLAVGSSVPLLFRRYRSPRIARGVINSVSSVMFTPDGRWLVSSRVGGNDLWNMRTGKLREGSDLDGGNVIGCSADGMALYTRREGSTVEVWNTRDWAVRRKAPVEPGLFQSVAIAQDGDLVAIGGQNLVSAEGVVSLWSLPSGNRLRAMRGAGAFVCTVEFSSDGSRVGVASADGTTSLWNLTTNIVEQPLPKMVQSSAFPWRLSRRAEAFAYSCAHVRRPLPHLFVISPDGNAAVVGGADGTILSWRRDSPQDLSRWKAHDKWISSVAFSTDGVLLATGGRALPTTGKSVGEVKVWTAERQIIWKQLLGGEGSAESLAFSPNRRLLAVGDKGGSIRLCDVTGKKKPQRLVGHGKRVATLVFSPDGSFLASGSFDGIVCLWSTDTGKSRRTLHGFKGAVTALAFSPDGSRLAVAATEKLSTDRGSDIIVWSAKLDRVVRRYSTGNGILSSVAISRDGQFVAGGYARGRVCLWDRSTGKNMRNLPPRGSPVTRMEFSPDTSLLAVGHTTGEVRVWHISRGLQCTILRSGGSSWVRSVRHLAFSPSGNLLACATEGKPLQVWDLANRTGYVVPQFRSLGVAFSPDGRWLASGDESETVDLLEPATGRWRLSFWHTFNSGWAAYTPRGDYQGSPNVTSALFPPKSARFHSRRPEVIRRTLRAP